MKRPVHDPNWSPEVQEIWRNDMREMWDRNIERHSYNAYQNQLEFYRRLVQRFRPRSILDVGCAQATLALLLAEDGLDVTAIDIRTSFLDYAASRYEKGTIRFRAANILDAEDLGCFDLIFANQIIEHLVYPVSFLRALGKHMNPGGLLVVTTPNHDYFRSKLPSYTELGDPRQHEHRQFTAGGGDHFFAYTAEELRAAGVEAGFNIVDISFFESPWISGHALVRLIHPVFPVRLLRLLDRLALLLAPRKVAHQLCIILGRPM